MVFSHCNMITKIIIIGILGFLMVLPIIAVGTPIFMQATSTPYWDDWTFIQKFDLLLSKEAITWNDLWSQHNEHRLLLFHAIGLILAKFFHFKLELLIYGSVFVSILNLGLIAFLLKPMVGKQSKETRALCMIVASWFVFSPIQWENWTWPDEIIVFLSITGVLVTAIGIKKIVYGQQIGIVIMIFGTLLATYSFGSGMVLWLAVIPILAALAFQQRKKHLLAVWLAITALHYILYSVGYVKPAYHPALAIYPEQWGALFKYVLVYLGSPISGAKLSTAFTCGLVLLFAFVISIYKGIRKNKLDILYPWMLIVLFVLGVALLTGIVRSGFGVDQALASRYTSYALLAWVATFVMMTILSSEKIQSVTLSCGNVKLLGLVFGLTVILFFSFRPSYKVGFEGLSQRFDLLQTGFYTILNYKYVPEKSSEKLINSIASFQKGASILEERKWGPFASYNSQLILSCYSDEQIQKGGGAIESIVFSEDQKNIVISGWTVLPDAKKTSDIVYIVIDHSLIVSVKPSIIRKDIEKQIGVDKRKIITIRNRWAGNYGWSVVLDKGKIGNGQHTIGAITGNEKVSDFYRLAGLSSFSI